MKKNIGTIDRVTRILLSAIIAFLYFTNVITGTPAIILIGVALVLVITGFLSFCPLYFVLGFKSIKSRSQ